VQDNLRPNLVAGLLTEPIVLVLMKDVSFYHRPT